MNHRAGFTTVTSLLALAVIGIGLTAGILVTRLNSTQTTQTQATENPNISYMGNDAVQIEIKGPVRHGGSWDYAVDGTLCFIVQPPSVNGKYRVELWMPTKNNPQGELIGASLSRLVTNPSTLRCSASSRIRRDDSYTVLFDIPDHDTWQEPCPTIGVYVTTDGTWDIPPSTQVASINKSFLCPQGEPTAVPTAVPTSPPPPTTAPQAPTSVPPTTVPTTAPSAPSTPTAPRPTTRPNTSQLDGRITVYSCNQPESVVITICNERGLTCTDIPYGGETVTEQTVWYEDSGEDRTHLYSYIATQDPNGNAIEAGKKYSIRSASAKIQTDEGVKTYTSPRRDTESVTAPTTRDFTINTGDETCSCPFRAKAYVKDLDTGDITNVLDESASAGYRNGVSNDLQIAARGNKPLLAFKDGLADTGDLDFWDIRANKDVPYPFGPYGIDGLASIRLFAPDYDVVSQECSSFGAVHACPGSKKNYERSNFNFGDEGKDFKDLRVACGTDLEYGWVIKKKPIASTPVPQQAGSGSTPPPSEGTDRYSHDSLLVDREGFGASVTGGQGGEVLNVTSLEDDPIRSVPGTLRWALERDDPAIVRFSVNGVIPLAADIDVQSNKTIDGRGSQISLTQNGLNLEDAENVIIANIAITQGSRSNECDTDTSSGDAIQLRKSHGIWIHHVTLSNFCDGLLDIVSGSNNVTVSWTKIEHHNKAVLIGNSNNKGDVDKNITVTMHHNIFSNLIQRLPRVRFGKVDLYNNYYLNWHGNAITHTLESELIIENNIFEVGPNTPSDEKRVNSDNGGEDASTGFARAIGNMLLGGAQVESVSADRIFARPYTAQIEPATEALKQTLLAEAGAQPPAFYEQHFGVSGQPNFNTDVNNDGVTNTTDLTFCITEYGQSGLNLVSDINADGVVNAVDYSAIIANLQSS